MDTNRICFTDIRKAFEEYQFALGYSPKTAETYRWIFSRLGKFMTERGETVYSSEIGLTFLKKELELGHSVRQFKRKQLTIRRLNDFLNGVFSVAAPKNDLVPDCYTKDFNNYLEYLRFQGLRKSTIQGYYYSCSKMLRTLCSLRIYDLSIIQTQDIYDVLKKSDDKINISASLRRFLRYLFKSGVLSYDLSVFVPSVRERKPVPSVFTKDEIKQLISSIDTEQSTGKRNYAIILLALRLGIRSGDITNLKLSDIDFQSNVIEFTQGKTRVSQQLEFLPELKEAINMYLSEARPKTEHPNLFISVRPPFRPLTVMAVTSLIRRCMSRSGIVIAGRKHGGHALRTTLASELVSEKVPYEVVRKILGHEDTKSMKHYVKFDVEMLRSCALAVSPLTGLYAEYVNNCKKGGEK